ncbi:hypothetical protein GND95_07585 [Defluviitalea raffinosedens]|uniref:Uncharacterized protein n=1 Tax=Defluviitalea raffinosedens TaxID=1450156 RepID=A0A7C8LCN1_9FIRM|nr:hypothetical protein [Defluviitalea raffinosedens]KAE9634521.1 hypothetical protein GND95_07585 [Defluviitalea raffinosedens]
MSAFLGPIHYWLYNKIVLFEALEKSLVETYINQYGKSIGEIYIKYCDRYGDPVSIDEPLENIIDQSNIHGWLQGKISIAETRQAAFLNEVLNIHGKQALHLASDIYSRQGAAAGKRSQSQEAPSSAPELFKALNNYILDGMPCDRVNEIIVSEEECMEWKTVFCLHIGYWNAAGADPDIFYTLRKQWISAFIENANPDYKYEFEKISDSLSHKILKGGR